MDRLTLGAPAAVLILVVMVAASLLALRSESTWIGRHLLRPFWLVPKRQWITVVTSGFLHADLPHLLFNAFTFYAFGPSLERAMGTPKFVALYAVGLVASAAGTWLAHRKEPEYASLGASGAILAVLFASIVYTPTQSIFIFPLPIPIPAPLFAVLYLAFTWYAARAPWRGRVNHDAHLSGAIAGIAFVALADPAAFARGWQQVFG